MSKFSLSSHPCGMQDESCPNGAHSCYFGGLCRCVPGHPGRENHTQPRLLLPWQLVRRWRKGGTAPLKGWAASSPSSPFQMRPGDAGGRTRGCQGSSWDKADSREAETGSCSWSSRETSWEVRQHWKTALFILRFWLDFPQCQIRREFSWSERQRLGQ